MDNGFPSALPPIKDVSHQIDLIPRENFPNKEAYKMMPSQNVEIAIQIQDLFNKGLIRKILIPCAIPTVLALKKDAK